MEIERDAAVETARALKEELAAAKERAAALAATVVRLRERLQSTRGDEERMGMGRMRRVLLGRRVMISTCRRREGR